jgi:dTDP-4-dehydrorhamnose 3,5-epimerase
LRFVETRIDGLVVVEPETREDGRGSFYRAYCTRELSDFGVEFSICQMNVSTNRRAGTIRGLHFQRPPASEAKLFRCTRGRTFHVAVDLRPDSPTYRDWLGIELSAESGRQVLMPHGCAAGYQALVDEAEVSYAADAPYSPEHEGGLRFDDPALGIEWPLEATSVSDKDKSWPLLAMPAEGALR